MCHWFAFFSSSSSFLYYKTLFTNLNWIYAYYREYRHIWKLPLIFILCVILASNVSSSSNRSCIFFFLSHPTSFLCMSPVFGGSIALSLHCWTTYFVKITQSVGKPNQMIISGCTETNPLASSSIQCVWFINECWFLAANQVYSVTLCSSVFFSLQISVRELYRTNELLKEKIWWKKIIRLPTTIMTNIFMIQYWTLIKPTQRTIIIGHALHSFRMISVVQQMMQIRAIQMQIAGNNIGTGSLQL